MKILILGGYGVFGGRLAVLLAGIAELELLICGRDAARATAFCAAYRGLARVRPVVLDRRDIVAGLRQHTPDLVVDASGPFQDYGDDSYHVLAACIVARIDYLDFADAADFVFGISRFDAAAKAAGIVALSGVSSFPALTSAVLRELAQHMEIEAVEAGVAPSPYAGIGLNVVRAIASYAGAPVKLRRGGASATGIGLAESRRFTVAPPGRLPLRNTRFSLVDVPDLRVIPPAYPSLRDIWIGAGTQPELLHRLLNLLARLRAWLRLPSLDPLAPLFHAVLNRTRFGERRGGMYVIARDGGTVMSWHLLAEGDDGPFIPCMAVVAIVRRLLRGDRPAPGARPAAHALALSDYAPLFQERAIYTGFRTEAPSEPIYRQILGSAFDTLPPRVRQLHDSPKNRQWRGVAQVRRGRGMMARMIAAVFGFPAETAAVPVAVDFTLADGAERWTRNFGGRRFASLQSLGTGRDQYLLVERFGLVTVALALVVEGGRLYLVPRRWRIAGVPMPQALLPTGASFEAEVEGQFRFDVTIAAPIVGLIVAYRGTLEPT